MGYNLLAGVQIFAPNPEGREPRPSRRGGSRDASTDAERNTLNGLNNQAHGAERKRAPRAQLNKIFRFYILFIEL